MGRGCSEARRGQGIGEVGAKVDPLLVRGMGQGEIRRVDVDSRTEGEGIDSAFVLEASEASEAPQRGAIALPDGGGCILVRSAACASSSIASAWCCGRAGGSERVHSQSRSAPTRRCEAPGSARCSRPSRRYSTPSRSC